MTSPSGRGSTPPSASGKSGGVWPTPKSWVPLYPHVLSTLLADANAGLRFEKFVGWEDPEFRDVNRSEFAKQSAGVVGADALLREAAERRERLVEAVGGTSAEFQTATRLAVGLGASHPLENGMTWHPTLGVPYLPATSVKGMARSWATTWEQADPKVLDRIFGPRPRGGSRGQPEEDDRWVGTVCFFDAVPVRPVRVEADVMTPHHAKYYRGEGPAADWDSPVIIPFMTVAANTAFLISLAPRGDQASVDDVNLVWQWVYDALSWIGIGAKTSSGYGRLTRREVPKVVRLEKPTAVPVARSPLHQQMIQDGYENLDQLDRFKGLIRTIWVPRLQESEPEEAREIAELLRDWYLAHDPAQWQKPNAKSAAAIRVIKQIVAESDKGGR